MTTSSPRPGSSAPPSERARPDLSIVIASYNSEPTIEACLRRLVAQCDPARVEILVVDSGSDGAHARVERAFPTVRAIRSEQRLYPGGARNLGVEQSRGALLAFIDADCRPAPDWVERLRLAHQRPAAVIGGVVAAQDARGPLDWAAYFCSFHQWMPGASAGAVPDIPTCCLSMKRWAFERYGPFRAHGFSSDTELNWRVIRGGDTVELDPELWVTHRAHPSPAAFAHRLFVRGRAFGRLRVRAEQLSVGQRVGRSLAAPLIPWLLSKRLLVRALTTPCPYRRQLLYASPLVFVGYQLWSAGEAIGTALPATDPA